MKNAISLLVFVFMCGSLMAQKQSTIGEVAQSPHDAALDGVVHVRVRVEGRQQMDEGSELAFYMMPRSVIISIPLAGEAALPKKGIQQLFCTVDEVTSFSVRLTAIGNKSARGSDGKPVYGWR